MTKSQKYKNSQLVECEQIKITITYVTGNGALWRLYDAIQLVIKFFFAINDDCDDEDNYDSVKFNHPNQTVFNDKGYRAVANRKIVKRHMWDHGFGSFINHNKWSIGEEDE